MEALLAPLGRRIVLAESGEEALRILLAERFALILLDVQMPGMDGFETARLIRGRLRTAPDPDHLRHRDHQRDEPHVRRVRRGGRRLPAEAGSTP